ncbi:glycosyltransferase [Acidobacteriota bacterium]
MRNSSYRIAIMGIRGIPANYGGFETLAEQLAPNLAERGYDMTVYCRSNIIKYRGDTYKGVKLVILPTISNKYLDTVFHTFLCVLHSLFRRYNVIFILNAANSIFAILPRIFGKKVVVNVDGIERERKKWNALGKAWYLMGEIFSVIFPNEIVTDAKVIQNYYRNRYHKESNLISYGASTERASSQSSLIKFGIKPNDYLLYVSRLEPENNAHIVLKAFNQVKTNMRLVIVGDAPYASEYISSLKSVKDKRVIFTGFVFGQGYKEFLSHAYCYIHATEVGGTHPALIEAMGIGNTVIVNGTPENIEVLGGAGLMYKKNDVEDLRQRIQFIIDTPQLKNRFGNKAQERIENYYNWKTIIDQYEKLFIDLAG